MKAPLMRIPYTGPLPPPTIYPRTATTPAGAADALQNFLLPSSAQPSAQNSTLLLTGAGISVASGLADYRGTGGTYTLNKTYRPIYYNEFTSNHEARKRYWARSFLGWTNLHRAKPNVAHQAVRDLGALGLLSNVITQNVDSFHSQAHPSLPTIELHGYLRSLICINCHAELPRAEFQQSLTALNPAWAEFLEEMLAVGALNSENPDERQAKGLKSNPDGDVDVPNAPYTTFRYPACPACLQRGDTDKGRVDVDAEGAWLPSSAIGILKPAVVMFGESICADVKDQAEQAVLDAARILVVGSSLATYSAWRLVKLARERGKGIGILNLGGVRGEETLFGPGSGSAISGHVRCDQSATKVLPMVAEALSLRLQGTKQAVADYTVPAYQSVSSNPLRTPS